MAFLLIPFEDKKKFTRSCFSDKWKYAVFNFIQLGIYYFNI